MKKIIFCLMFLLLFLPTGKTFSKEISLDIKVLNIDTPTLKKGYTINGFDGKFRVGIFPSVLSVETQVVLKDFYQPEKILPLPANKKIISHIYEFDIANKSAFKNKKPLIIEIKYDSDYPGFKSVYYWDKGKNKWIKIPSFNDTGRKKMRANLHLPYARLAVFEDKEPMETGVASWYNWKGCDCAASPDYPKGTLLEVTNLKNGKSVTVVVNDYGPERDKFPERVIDLDKVAFQKIANPLLGVCKVRVKPVNKKKPIDVNLPNKNKTVLNQSNFLAKNNKKETVAPDFKINAHSAIVINAKTGEILYEKNSHSRMPIASITKLMTAKVILDLNPDWDKLIKYSETDNDVMRYAAKREMAYLYVSPGEIMTVKDLFFSSLVGSANNAVYALVRSSGLLRRDFVEVMNRKAKELGMLNTHFTEPSGLDPRNQSTVYDLAKLGRKIFNNFKILEATTSKRYVFSTVNTHNLHIIKNHNKLLNRDLYILGTKTGYLEEAGRCLIVKAKNEKGKEIIVVTLGNFSQDKSNYFDETEKLVKWGFEIMEKGLAKTIKYDTL